MLPLKRVGSWGMMLSLVLKSFNPIEHMLTPSIRISPLEGSTKRNKALISVLFPLPVLPTTPTLLPSLKVQVIPLSTNGALGRYLIWNQCKKQPSEENFSVQFRNIKEKTESRGEKKTWCSIIGNFKLISEVILDSPLGWIPKY